MVASGGSEVRARSAPGSPMQGDLSVEVWAATDVGREREGNEDAVFPDSQGPAIYTPKAETLARKGQLLVVADGVGGAQAGSEASQWALRRAVERYYELPQTDLAADLRHAVSHANASLTQYLRTTGISDAGTTMAAAVIHDGTLSVANVGDSRVYLIRDGVIYQQTRDHTLTQQKLAQGLITAEEAELDSGNNVLVRSLGAASSVRVDLFPPIKLQAGDTVLLCSDGLYDMLGDAEIARLAVSGPPRRAGPRLIAAANGQGGYDNVSVILAQVGGAPATARAAVGASQRPGFTSGQRVVLIALATFLGLTIVAGATYAGWQLFGGRDDRRTTPPVSAVTSTPTAEAGVEADAPVATETPTPTATSEPDTETAPGVAATSTPRPTATPTPTSTLMPTLTWTPTATATPTPTSTPTDTPQLPSPSDPGEPQPPSDPDPTGTNAPPAGP